MKFTTCHCNHLTAFSSLLVPPNPLPRMSFALLKEGYVLFVVIAVVLGLYIVFFIVFRKLDRTDSEKVIINFVPSYGCTSRIPCRSSLFSNSTCYKRCTLQKTRIFNKCFDLNLYYLYNYHVR